MKVILLERIEKLGEMGAEVDVKAGFARNYLLPQSKALRATAENKESFESRRTELEDANAKRREEALGIAGGVDGITVILVRQASDSGQLYGSVRPRDIAIALKETGADIDRSQVRLDEPIKMIGLYKVRVALHPEVMAEITANIARSEDEAKLQARGVSMIGSERAGLEDDDGEASEETAGEASEEAETAGEDGEAEAADATTDEAGTETGEGTGEEGTGEEDDKDAPMA